MPEITVQQAFDLAVKHHQAGRLEEAEHLYRLILARHPAHMPARQLCGVIAHQTGRSDLAVDLIRKAIALKPDHAEAHNNLGNALKETGQLDEAIAEFRKAIALNPSYHEAHSNLIFAMHLHPAYDALAIAEEHRRWDRQHVEPLRPAASEYPNDRRPDRRLRVGYVSADFRIHASAFFLAPLLKQHDRAQMELICYSHVVQPDSMTAQFKQDDDVWRDIVGLTDEQVADQIRRDSIDILVDLKTHTAENRLLVFAHKPAPVQVTWLGTPGGTGLTAIDFRLSDPYLDPLGMDESVYSERTIRLPETFWCYDPLDGHGIPVSPLPAPSRHAVTFGSLNNFCKVNDQVLALWAQVLRQVDDSRLLLLSSHGNHRQRTLERLQQEGIEPSRVEFVAHQPRRDYLLTYHRIDLGLDTFPFNGHTTSLDSFWMGVPVVTLVGNRSFGRAGWSQLSNLGLQELAGQSPEQFVRIAVELAKDQPRLAHLRFTLRQRMQQSPLMDAPRFARNIEAAYRQMWQTWCEAIR
jgi:protein O-GlcNAc transferase